MRVLSGKYKNKLIKFYSKGKESGSRPTKAKVRAAVFNMLTSGLYCSLEDAKILDVFCGSGAYSIEALSHGASSTTLIDNDPKALASARENIANLNDANINASYILADATKNLDSYNIQYDIIFLDPPYFSNLANELLYIFSQNESTHSAIIVAEVASKIRLNIPECYDILTERKYGNTKIYILAYKA